MTNRIPRLDALQALKALYAKLGKASPATENTDVEEVRGNLFYHPRGSRGVYDAWHAHLEAAGVEFRFQHQAVGFERDGARVTGVRCQTPDGSFTLPVDGVVSTLPLPRLIQKLDGPDLPSPGLQFRSLLIFGLLVRAEKLLPAYFVYYHNRVFGRLSEPKNTGLKVTPADATTLLVEVPCSFGDEQWENPEALLDAVLADLEAEGVLRRKDIIEWHVMRQRYAYPLFLIGFEPALEAARAFVADLPNLRTAGRQGDFRYVNQHIAIKSGMAAAERLLRSVLTAD